MIVKKLRDHKGLSMEIAIGIMFIMFAVSMLLYAITSHESKRDTTYNKGMSVAPQLEEVGEDYYYLCQTSTNLDNDLSTLVKEFNINTKFQDSYYATTNSDTTKNLYTLTIKEKINDVDTGTTLGGTVLEVQIYKDTTTTKITSWYFDDPVNGVKVKGES